MIIRFVDDCGESVDTDTLNIAKFRNWNFSKKINFIKEKINKIGVDVYNIEWNLETNYVNGKMQYTLNPNWNGNFDDYSIDWNNSIIDTNIERAFSKLCALMCCDYRI